MAAWQDILDAQDAIERQSRTAAIPTGIAALDVHLFGGGFREGQIILVGARPGVGKSSFMLNCALNQARAGYTVGIVSLEMSARHLAEILAQIESDTAFQKFYRVPMMEWESDALEGGIHRVCGLPIWVDDASRKTVEQVTSRIAQMVNVERCDIVYVDYAQRISFSGKNDSVRELNHISERLTECAKELSAPIVALAQLNRDLNNSVPKLENFKGSGQFEQDAHIALLLHRPNADKDGEIEDMEIHLAKQRRGVAHAHVHVKFTRSTQRIA
jgi:replicative DNA helicase